MVIKTRWGATFRKRVTVSDSKWISWGGLKWCPEERFQHHLNREGCQSDELDNPNPRQYKDMNFYEDITITRKVNKAVSNYKKGIY
ncbi:spore protein H [Bacillus pacificus]